jgi:hypothetical protein
VAKFLGKLGKEKLVIRIAQALSMNFGDVATYVATYVANVAQSQA